MFGLTWSKGLTHKDKNPGNLCFGLLICIYFVYAIEATFRVAINNNTTAAIIIDFGSRPVVP